MNAALTFTGTGRVYDGRGRTVAAGEAMPFKSQAQRRKFAELLVQGKISAETFEEWNVETGSRKLPERVRRPSTASRRRTTAKK
jgi:hypothetical protein